MYIYEHKNWPNLDFSSSDIAMLLAEVRHLQGRLIGRMEVLGFDLREEASVQSLTYDVLKTSEIEGENLDTEQVRSSIARRLGVDIRSNASISRDVEGIVEVMLDATQRHNAVLSKDRLCGWHAALFPTGRSGMQRINVGNWRDQSSGEMVVVSGAFGREKVHYKAPEYERMDDEMNRFLHWYNQPSEIDLVLKAAIAHFWFVTIHPFDDGNGRIARAIADMTLAKSEGSAQRFYSMSSQIEAERKNYYDILESSQKGDLNITAWIKWFLNCLKRAIESSDIILSSVLARAKFWDMYSGVSLNERQRTIVNLLLSNFEGNLTSSKWAKITKCSQDTALRDITSLLKLGILMQDSAGGRSTSYSLVKSPR